MEFERLRIQYESLVKTETEQQEFIEQLILQSWAAIVEQFCAAYEIIYFNVIPFTYNKEIYINLCIIFFQTQLEEEFNGAGFRIKLYFLSAIPLFLINVSSQWGKHNMLIKR
jgi:hypothetical protein